MAEAMTADQTHYDEATYAREVEKTESSRLRRLLWMRAVVLTILGLLVYAHWHRVSRLNQDLARFPDALKAADATTVLSFLATHRTDDDYLVQLDDSARTLEQILGDIGAVLQQDISLATHGKYTVREVLRLARTRPAGIKITLPYMGEVTLPISFGVLAFCCGLGGLAGNVFILLRQQALDALEGYIDAHLRSTLDGTHAPLKADPGADAVQWPPYMSARPTTRMFFEVLGGLSLGRLRARRFDLLLEGGTALVTCVLILSMFTMAWYLFIEGWTGSHQTLTMAVSMLLGCASPLAATLAIAAVGERALTAGASPRPA